MRISTRTSIKLTASVAFCCLVGFGQQGFFGSNFTTGGGGTPITQVGSVQTATALSGATATTPSGFTTTGATLLIVTMTGGADCASSTTISDSNANTWHALTPTNVAGGGDTCIWYSYDKAGSALVVGANHTVSLSNSFPALSFTAWTGTTAGHVDPYQGQENSAFVSSASCPCTIQPGSITPTASGALVVTSLGSNGGTSTSINSGFTAIGIQDFASGTNYGNAMGYLVQGSASAVNPTWTLTSGSTGTGAVIASFK